MTNVTNTRELIEAWPFFTEPQRAALLTAVSTRGKWKGCVRASAPATSDGTRFAAWQALIGNLAPARMSTYGLLWMPEDDQRLYKELDKACSWPTFRMALNAFEPPYRWNLWAHQYDVDKCRQTVNNVLTQLAAEKTKLYETGEQA